MADRAHRSGIEFDETLVRRYDVSGPRYTSYPTAPQFHAGFAAAEYDACAAAADDRLPLSLYFHIPFCATLCFYCACNKVVTKNRAHATPYLAGLGKEIALQSERFGARPSVDQLHWGGGTPTFLSDDQIRALFDAIAAAYPLRDDDQGDYSIELDPRAVSRETVQLLRTLGFNRASLGVQDLNADVQRAVNRIQPESVTQATLDACREAGFHSVNMDLIYGLPLQTLHSFTRTLDRVIEMGPDRVALYNYAHLPQRFTPQRRIRGSDLPNPSERLAILRRAIHHLEDAGYVYIGMDHFARAEDPLARALEEGTLTRNFQGYSTHGECDIVAHGISAIGSFGQCYAQNYHDQASWFAALAEDRIPVARGLQLSREDCIRRSLIMHLMCDFRLDWRAFSHAYGIDNFAHEFGPELAALVPLQRDGLVRWHDEVLEVTPIGRLLVRNIAMIFDRYLANDRGTRWSRAI